MAAAFAALAGMDPIQFLRDDAWDRDVKNAVARAVEAITERRNHNLAVLIANKVGELFS